MTAPTVHHGPDGYELHVLRVERDLLEMEAVYAKEGHLPPEHFHPSQDEHFEVVEGEIRTILAGEERTYGPGEAFDVPAGTPHQMVSTGPARMRWEVRPALRTAELFAAIYGDGPGTLKGGMPFSDFLEEFSAEFRLSGN